MSFVSDKTPESILGFLGKNALKGAIALGNPTLAAIVAGMSIIDSMNNKKNNALGALQNSLKTVLGLDNLASGNIAKSPNYYHKYPAYMQKNGGI